jgi:hypothetical protein
VSAGKRDGITFCAAQVPTEIVNKAAEMHGLKYVTNAALMRVAIAVFAGFDCDEAIRRFAQSPTKGAESLQDDRPETVSV